MWNFLKNGKQKSNIPVLKNLVNTFLIDPLVNQKLLSFIN